MLILPNYQIKTRIYESTNSLIYRGIRQKDNQPIILKILKQDYPTPEELTRYRQEYEITHDLNVTGVIKVYGIEKYQNTLVIILEDFGGESLKQLMAERPFSIKEFLPLAIAIADSLGNIHADNIIHKDINPANIVWNQTTNQLKIIDFGISSRLPRENPTLKNPEQLEGTLAYLSPEQTGRMNRSLDYRTDLYSLGVTFYELLTGQLPYESTDALELVHCHIAKPSVPVCEINPDIPQIISDIVMKLMAKNAEDRYQSAFGVKFDLENLINLENLSDLSFELAQNDFSGQLQIPQKLYGRDLERKKLLTAFERITKGKNVEMMLVAGYSGIGKSVLVKEIYKSLTEKHGYFIVGKFDQFQHNIPYSAVINAFKELVQQLLTENQAQLSAWKEKLLSALGPNGQIIIDVIPEIEWIIGPQPTVPQLGLTEAQNRFNRVFQNFMRVFCQPAHPLVIFLDDLQWVDSATLKLLELIMIDNENLAFFLIGAYRDNEVDPTHPLITTLDKLHQSSVTIKKMTLKPLGFQQINQLVSDCLSHDLAAVGPLTELLMRKTNGNPFFVNQFLHSLYEENLLHFIPPTVNQKGDWQWEIAQIEAINITDNVVDFMIGKLKKLPNEAQQILRLAACIGNRFDLETLSVIYEKSVMETFQDMMQVLTDGFILPSSSLELSHQEIHASQPLIRHFHFLHDRIQQAAYSLIPNAKKQSVHQQVGQLLLKNTSTDQLEHKIFDIVNQLNFATALLKQRAQQEELAQLNLMAGKKAKAAAAYQPALKYFNMGREFLTEKSWEQQYELMLALHIESTETAYLNGHFELMDQLVQTVLEHAQNWLDKVPVYQVKIAAYQAQNQLLKGFNTGLDILKLLDISFPAAPTPTDFMSALQETQLILADKPIESLINLPYMTDQQQLAAVQILSSIFSASYQAAPAFMPLLVFKQITLSVQYGNTPEAAFAYANYGLILCALASDIENGYHYGQLALKLLDKFQAKELKARTYVIMNNLVRHWKEHVKQSLPPLLEGYQAGLDTGDLEWAAWCIVVYYYHAYLSGSQLAKLAQDMTGYHETIAKLKQQTPLHWQQLYLQVVLNLRGESAHDPTEFTGPSYHEANLLPQHLDANDRTMLSHFYLNKTMLYYLFGKYALAVEYASMAENYLDSAVGLLVTAYFYFYDSLARLADYRNQPNEDILKKVSMNQEKIAYWAKHAPMNYQHKFYLVEAEYARALGKYGEAIEFYDQAIELAQEHGYFNEAALAYELIAQFYLAKGKSKVAQVYLRDAHYAYQQWGALAKVADLEANYPQLLATPKIFHSNVTATTTLINSNTTWFQASTLLDLDSITKASQTLTGEIILSKLLKKMMHIVIENAGAQRGFLILPHDDKWVIEAEGTLNKNKITVLHSRPIENNLPEAIINYVARTQENVVLADAKREGLYTENPYIQTHQIQSVLCFPIVYQQQLRAILYFENNLTTGAFTPQRLKVLKMLSSQIAISLENAEYATQLEDKVKQRTKQLAAANDEIMLLNERLKKENLRMSAELDVAKQLQQMVLPKEEELQQIENLDIAGFMEPADEIGGDYYEILNYEGQIKIGIGDVTGHGLESGVLMLMVQTTVRALLLAGIDNPEHFLNIVNKTIYHNAKRMGTDKNLTLSLLDYFDGQLQITGQHEEVLVVREGGKIERMDTFDLGFSVGIRADIAPLVAHETFSLKKNEGIVLYTDGITEAQNLDEEQYGIERLCEVVSTNWQQSAQKIQQAVIVDVRQFIGEQKVFDDITLLILKQK